MIIGVDFRFGYKSNRGMGTYAREIVKCLVRMEARYLVVYRQGERIPLEDETELYCLLLGYFLQEELHVLHMLGILRFLPGKAVHNFLHSLSFCHFVAC